PVRVSAVSGDVTVLRGTAGTSSAPVDAPPVQDAAPDAPAWGSPGAPAGRPASTSGPVDR
ncbi:hypothetical protein, partial [Cellulosimicrobium funkei]